MKKMMATVFVAALALLANQSALARNPYKDYVKESERVLTSPDFQAELARVLQPEDHQQFNNNLGAYISGTEFGSQSPFYGSALYGSLAYYEEGAPFSGVVIAPNGYYYIVYQSKGDRHVSYITNDGYCTQEPHDVMKIFTNSYAWNKEGIYHLDVKPARETLVAPHDCSKVYGFEGVKKQFDTSKRYQLRVAETEAQKNLRMTINSIWDSSITSSWNMNDKMVDLMGEVVMDIERCSMTAAWVPKPPSYTSKPGWDYFVWYAVDVVNYYRSLSSNRRYKLCITGAAVRYRSLAEMASAGVYP